MSNVEVQELRFLATEEKGTVSALLMRPANAQSLLVLGHGAGAGMHHATMELTATTLADAGVATFRYQFPYMERGAGGMDSEAVRLATVRAAVQAATDAAPDLPLLAGGRSMGGRMTSTAAAEEPLDGVRGNCLLWLPASSQRQTGDGACRSPGRCDRTHALSCRVRAISWPNWTCCNRFARDWATVPRFM